MRGVKKLRPKRIITIGIALVALVGRRQCFSDRFASVGHFGGEADWSRRRRCSTRSRRRSHQFWGHLHLLRGGRWYGASLCEVLTFGKKTFTGDGGDAGKFKSASKAVTVTFKQSGILIPGVFTGTFEWADTGANGINQYGSSFNATASTPTRPMARTLS